ncbi:hypothetical protein [Cellulomonas septica]|uniref:Uncharacterized protein n=1 Tax=Cellulomonas septica TaxID=285080 RepID=A0ABX1JXV7_9CELL|nr:hypothetical protein [Cellulomonas septica]NKY38135.1 hypothetical protein [Cellulomonas septica]
MSVTTEWMRARRELLLELAALPATGDVLDWQRRLANAIIEAESPPDGTDRVEAKRHRHLLRVIADGLVHALLPEHTIRSLSRHPGKPPSLSAQGTDFDFVFDQAASLFSLGFVPIIADITTLIGIGDIVGWQSDGVVVLECKNRPAPAQQASIGRLARQRRRGEQVETYLTSSRVDEGDVVRQAHTLSLPGPDWEAVADLLERRDASPSGTAAYSLGPADTLVAATSRSTSEEFMEAVPSARGTAQMAIAFYSELFEGASYRLMAPSSYPIQADHRSRLLEGELQLVRLSDLGSLAADFHHDGAAVAMVPERSNGRLDLRVDVDGLEHTRFTHQLAEYCLWMPVPVAALRETLVGYTRALLSEQASGVEMLDDLTLAPGDNFKYMTVYRPG